MVTIICAFIISFSFAEPLQAETTKMTPLKVSELLLNQGYKTKEVNLQFLQTKLLPVEVASRYDWNLSLEADYEDDRSQFFYPLPSIPNSTYKRYYTDISLKKPFSSGTTLGISYDRVSQSMRTNFVQPGLPPAWTLPLQTQDVLGVNLEQSLLKNFFGIADRASLESADLSFRAAEILRADGLQRLVLESLRQFWDCYVAQETLKESMASRDRYKDLIAQVRRKTAEGYANAGELPQVEAEFESQEQKVKENSTLFITKLENLISLLNLPQDTNLEFVASESVPEIPKMASVDVEGLRPVQAQKLKMEAANQALKASSSSSYPDVSLIGRAYSTGYDQTSDGSLSSLSAGNHPKYYVGLKFAYHFGSNVQNEDVSNKKATRDLEETRLARQKLEQRDALSQAEIKVQSKYAIVQSADRQRVFRDKTVKELKRTYMLGRTDVRLLIDAINDQFSSQVNFWRSIGDYQIALNEWAAVRDELIPKVKLEQYEAALPDSGHQGEIK